MIHQRFDFAFFESIFDLKRLRAEEIESVFIAG